MPRKIEISHKTIIFAVLFLVSLGFIYHVRDLIIELFVALVIMAILDPVVSKLSSWRIPRALSVFISYILFFGILGSIIALIIPPLVDQTTSFANSLPGYIANLNLNPAINKEITNQLLLQVGKIPEQTIKFGMSIFSNILAVFTVLVFAFYMLLSRSKLDEQLGFFFGDDKKIEIARLLNHLEIRLGGWARGQIGLMVIVGIANFIALTALRIPFALPLAILAGILEIVPFIGPIVAAVPAVIIAFGISPLAGCLMIAAAFLIQQVESYVFVPKIMEKSVGVSPIITLMALAIGQRFSGVVGMIISVPLVITIHVLVKEYFSKE
ncbi:MAG TPA: AI-2E family transporter [Alphaproteobacteria bacterium]|jgi:predicted PurR-regulated permease PerM|nr:AI-2E family transporter [Alphaproteobacteria bacterium]